MPQPSDSRPPVAIRPYTPRSAASQSGHDSPSPPPPPAKRGRKPGPLSRTAREAQRRLNHSIIEKARRTKINDALATLKQLVPIDYDKGKGTPANDGDDDDPDDDDFQEGSKLEKPKAKTPKREEKEFKLEILVRTVTFLQDLLKRVETLEKTPATCDKCATRAPSATRKRAEAEEDTTEEVEARPAKRQHRAQSPIRPSVTSESSAPPSSTAPAHESPSDGRLPSISTWLPNPKQDTASSNSKPASQSPPTPSSYLPTPPSSTRFDPVRPVQYPPTLNLGPVATIHAAAPTVRPHRTSEDETAASLLLQISTSPPFRPIPSSNSPVYGLTEPSHFRLQSDVRTTSEPNRLAPAVGTGHHVQTPGSLLGLTRKTKGLHS